MLRDFDTRRLAAGKLVTHMALAHNMGLKKPQLVATAGILNAAVDKVRLKRLDKDRLCDIRTDYQLVD